LFLSLRLGSLLFLEQEDWAQLDLAPERDRARDENMFYGFAV
jgi:hypothetical protein